LISNLIPEFERNIENKIHLRNRSLIDQERHLSLERPTSELVNSERERENTPSKYHQGKT
jgi:hypothetical protein